VNNADCRDFKYVFVCGLGRSGTSVLGRNVARLENCTGFKNTGVLEDEGQFLQDVYPNDHAFGGAGRCGFDPRAHLTEASEVLTPENALKLRRSWEQYWDPSKTIRVEKTPGNLLMSRFLQAVFPNSYFIVIRRHPVPVSMATQKWKVSFTSLHSLFEHWLHCHALFDEDKKYLRRVYELTYEDYIENPDKHHEEIAAFIGTRVPEPPKQDTFHYVVQWRNPQGLRVPERAMEDVTGAHNQKYLNRWRHLLIKSPFKSYYRYIARTYECRFAEYGYSLTTELGMSDHGLNAGGSTSSFLGPMYCLAADMSAFLLRSVKRTKWSAKQRVRALLPKFLLTRIRQARQRGRVSKGSADLISPQARKI
jgi:hypothetical protein